MKKAKETLALALAVMMVMAVLVIPASATGADLETAKALASLGQCFGAL